MFNLNLFTISKEVFIVEYQIKNLENIDILKKKIDEGVGENDFKTNVKGRMTSFNYFINDLHLINIIKECEIFFKTFNFQKMNLIEAWGNILEKGQEVTEHDHRLVNVSGILYLTEGGPGTYFPEIEKTINEKIGKILFFDSRIKHSVRKSNYENKRYSIAFNFLEIQPWQN